MIVEKRENWRTIFGGAAWEAAFAAIERLAADAPPGKAVLLGDMAATGGADLFYSIDDTATKPAPDCKLEAHREYIDIHFVLAGEERIGWWPVDELEAKTPYHDDKDVIFFEHPQGEAPASVRLRPGLFAVMFPGDAHMPKVLVDGHPAALRKGVMKLRARLAGKQE